MEGDTSCVGMGVMLKEMLCENVVELRKLIVSVMIVVVFDKDVLRLTYGYAQQGGRSLEEKQSFCDEL